MATAALVTLTPLMVICAPAIKFDSPGPVIFKQRRIGFNDKEFHIFKFRTMAVTADGTPIIQASRDDARLTKAGRILRQTSIDELPQLFNVIKGHMSLLGPCPHALAHDIEYGQLIADYALRRHVKPGITGLAQVHGFREEKSQTVQMANRIEFDPRYINNWSLLLDLRIIVRTLFEVFAWRNP